MNEKLTLEQAAKELGLDRATLARGIREGKLPGIQIGRKYDIRREWIERYKRGEPSFWAPTGKPSINSPFIRRTS